MADVSMDENYGQVHGKIACLVFGQYFSHLGHIVQYDGSMDRCDDRLDRLAVGTRYRQILGARIMWCIM